MLPAIAGLRVIESSRPGGSAAVVFVKDGDIVAWDEASGESETIYIAGDASRVELSDDGDLVAFLRQSSVEASGARSQDSSPVGRNGIGSRELLSAAEMRSRLGLSESDSVVIPELQWIPNSHQLLYTVHSNSAGLYLLDVDTLAEAELLPTGEHAVFMPSPDGAYVGLMHWPNPVRLLVSADDAAGRVHFIARRRAVEKRWLT
jgi:hypothetical protein